jgi:hypothetical protein
MSDGRQNQSGQGGWGKNEKSRRSRRGGASVLQNGNIRDRES